MGLPLIDFRGKITSQTNAVLDALQQASGKERSEIVREVLDEWADEKIHESILLELALRREGLTGLERRSRFRESGPDPLSD